jgi:hypothetical protein
MIKLSNLILLGLTLSVACGAVAQNAKKGSSVKAPSKTTNKAPSKSASKPVTAPASADLEPNNFADALTRALRATKTVGSPADCVNCTTYTTENLKNVDVCKAEWLRMYQKDEVNITVVFGYMDDLTSNPSVWDKYAAQELREKLDGKGCIPGVNLCDFDRESQDTFVKRNVKGPDGYTKTVRIRVVHSSHSPDKKANYDLKTGSPTLEQAEQTRVAHDAFYGAINSSDVVVYAGHARFTCSPSFGPQFVTKNGAVSKKEALADPSGLESLKTAIQSSARPPKLMAILGCDCENLAGPKLRSVAPETAFIMPPAVINPLQATGLVYSTLDSVLGMRCEDDFNRSLQMSVDSNTAAGAPRVPMKATQMFQSTAVPPLRPPSPQEINGFDQGRQQQEWTEQQPPGQEEEFCSENPYAPNACARQYTPAEAPRGRGGRGGYYQRSQEGYEQQSPQYAPSYNSGRQPRPGEAIPLTPPMRYDQMGN